jgi:hypothetical protein
MVHLRIWRGSWRPRARGTVARKVVEQWFTFEYGGVPGGRGREVAHEVVELLGGCRVVGNRRRSYHLLHRVPTFCIPL